MENRSYFRKITHGKSLLKPAEPAHRHRRTNRNRAVLAIMLVLLSGAMLLSCGRQSTDQTVPLSAPEQTASGEAQSPRVSQPEEFHPIFSLFAKNGDVYLPTHGGTAIKLTENAQDIEEAALTADEEHLIVLRKDGLLYITDVGLKDQETIAEQATALNTFGNRGLVYTDQAHNSYRFIFDEKAPLLIGENIEEFQKNDNMDLLYTADGKVYYLKAEQQQAETLYDDSNAKIDLCVLSLNNEIAVWADYDHRKICISDHGEVEILDSPSALDEVLVFFTKDEKAACICDFFENSMWIKRSRQETARVDLNAQIVMPPHTASDLILYSLSSDLNDLYAFVLEDGVPSLYYVSPEGQTTPILSGIDYAEVRNGRLYYRDLGAVLYSADLVGAEVRNVTAIASDVVHVEISPEQNLIFYCAGKDEKNLFVYHIDTAESTQIGQNVLLDFTLGDTEDTVYFTQITDSFVCNFKSDFSAESIKYSYSTEYYGDLMKWTVGDSEAVRIASSVLQYSRQDFSSKPIHPSGGFYFSCFNHMDENNNYYKDLKYYDGTTVTDIASELIG